MNGHVLQCSLPPKDEIIEKGVMLHSGLVCDRLSPLEILAHDVLSSKMLDYLRLCGKNTCFMKIILKNLRPNIFSSRDSFLLASASAHNL